MTATLVHNTIEHTLHDLGWRQMADGFWYPADVSESLVRVRLDDLHYSIDRKNGDWSEIVTAIRSEFDARAFQRWMKHWGLTLDS